MYYPVSMIMKFSNTIIMIWLTNGRDQNLRIDAIVFMSSTKKLLYGLLAIRAMDCCNWPGQTCHWKGKFTSPKYHLVYFHQIHQ